MLDRHVLIALPNVAGFYGSAVASESGAFWLSFDVTAQLLA